VVYLAQIPTLASALKIKDGKLLATNRQSRWPERDAIAIVGINGDASLGPSLYPWPGLTHMRELSFSPDGRFVCAAGRDAGGVVMLDSNWNVVARLDMDNVAVQCGCERYYDGLCGWETVYCRQPWTAGSTKADGAVSYRHLCASVFRQKCGTVLICHQSQHLCCYGPP
jgi:hypothetical protein